MKHINRLMRSSSLASAFVVAGLALAACNRAAPPAAVQQAPTPTAALALTDASAPPLVDAPPVSALPSAPPARIGRLQHASDGYAFADRGYAMSQAFADAPPDYTFDYGGVRPWVWRADDQSEQVVEPVDGGDRYYYYRPGDDQPFLIRDPDYSYGYEDGELVVIYDRNGHPLSDQYIDQRADLAGRYLARARAIYDAAQSQQRQAVAAANWRARSTYLDNEQNQWANAQNQDDAWRAYHAEHDQDEQAQWDAERYRRQAEAARYAVQANDAQAAARFAQAAALALQLSQSHPQGAPPQAPQGASGRPGFGQPQAQGQARAGSVAAPPPAPVQPPFDRGAADRAAATQARSAQQAAAQQQAQSQQLAAQQQAAQRQHSLDASAQARITQQAATQQQARTQMEQRSAQQQQALDAQARARVAQQAAGQQQARAQMQQQAAQHQAAQRQQAQAQAAQQAAGQQQARAHAAQLAAQQAAQQAAKRQAQPPAQHAPAPKAPPAAQPKPAAPSEKPNKPGEPDRSHQKQPE